MTYRTRNRGTTADRGYAGQWPRLRKQWGMVIAAGNGWCTNPVCMHTTRYIPPGAEWDGGHDEQRRPRGPEHRWCNRAAAARKRNRLHPRGRRPALRVW